MPQDLPGFYYDAEKNRYFPIKGPIPGSSSSSAITKQPISKSKPITKAHQRKGIKLPNLLLTRELYGNVINSNKGKFSFQEEYRKIQASKPLICKYHGTERIADGDLEQIHADIEVPDGRIGTDFLLTGSLNGSLCLYEVGQVGQQFDNGVKCLPDRVWPLDTENQTGCVKLPGQLWRPAGASIQLPSSISCIKMARKYSSCTVDDNSSMQHVVITTLGSEASGGSVYILNLSEPILYNASIPMIRRRIYEIASFNCTVWTADCNSNGSRVVIGTNLGSAIVNIESGTPVWVCRCKSDVLSLQVNHTGNIVLCGLRNGAIVMVDARQKPEGLSTRLSRHQIPYHCRDAGKPTSKIDRNFTNQRFQLKGNICHSHTIFMPSSISCLAQLQFYDQYFLASSMDGSIKLYDHRLTQRGPVQSYEGSVNSHTRIQLGVDPSERMVMSGGEDSGLRIWNIKSGELLFEHKFMDSVPSVTCWPSPGGLLGLQAERHECRDGHWGAWLGSQEGLFFMHWP